MRDADIVPRADAPPGAVELGAAELFSSSWIGATEELDALSWPIRRGDDIGGGYDIDGGFDIGGGREGAGADAVGGADFGCSTVALCKSNSTLVDESLEPVAHAASMPATANKTKRRKKWVVATMSALQTLLIFKAHPEQLRRGLKGATTDTP